MQRDSSHLLHLYLSHSSATDSDTVKSHVRGTALKAVLWEFSHITEKVTGFLFGTGK